MWHEIFCWFRGLGTIACGFATYVCGDLNSLLVTLLIMIVIDYITGVMCGAVTHSLSSDVGFRGIIRKVAILVMVALGHMVDVAIGTGETVRNMVIAFYIANEGLSILENVVTLGLPVPDSLKKILETLKESANEKKVTHLLDKKGDEKDGSEDNL